MIPKMHKTEDDDYTKELEKMKYCPKCNEYPDRIKLIYPPKCEKCGTKLIDNRPYPEET